MTGTNEPLGGPLDEQSVLDALAAFGDRGLGRPLSVVAITASTNDDARRALDAGAPHGATFLADHQTAGRGREGRPWHSPPGSHLYLSSLLRLPLGPEGLAPFALAAGLAVARTVDAALGGERARIKWPNDVYLADHKVAGVLVEAQSRAGAAQAALVVGVGLNVAAATFPEGFRVPATSLASEGATVGRAWVAGALLHHLGDVTLQYLDGGLGSLLDAIRARDHLHGRAVMAGGVAGKAVGIGERGELLVEGATGVVPVVSGEVRWS